MTFEVIDSNQRLVERKRQRLSIADPDQQRSGKSRPLCYRQRVNGLVALAGIRQRLAHDRNNRP